MKMIDRRRTHTAAMAVTGRKTLVVALTATALALSALTAGGAQATTVWLCKPGLAHNPCKAPSKATVVSYEGSTRKEKLQKPFGAVSPPIDCFYVYPTVSEQATANANLEIELSERHVAIAQASRFSQDCKVYAPMYRQLTLGAIGKTVPPEAIVTAYSGVLAAWQEYLAKYNEGRGVVLIGHSQGTVWLKQLIKEQIDPNPALRKQLVSAILLGGNVLVPEGKLVGGSFQTVPACQSAAQTGCVIAYSSFAKEPPVGSFFGRPGSPLLEPEGATPGTQVLCVNPTLLTQEGAAGGLLPYAPTRFSTLVSPPHAATPWLEGPGLLTAQCRHENGASWLQVSPAPGISEAVLKEREALNELPLETIGPLWGLHLYDVNLALGNLVNTLGIQSAAYRFEH
jgi:DUF3089 family protein